jgi:hypothetical protein
MRRALPDAQAPRDLFEAFLSKADQFPLGLLEISRRVQRGDRSNSDAFYFKGLAFWNAVDVAMQESNGRGLGTRVLEVLRAKFDAEGRPPLYLSQQLGIAPAKWAELTDAFLGQ